MGSRSDARDIMQISDWRTLVGQGSGYCTCTQRGNISYTVRHKRSMKMLSIARPRPSMLIVMSCFSRRFVNTSLVNCAPWSVLKIYSATATSDGRIIAAGNAEKADGTPGSFIALTDLTGKLANVIQTTGFFPSNICQAPDGTVWSFGTTGYDEYSQPMPGDTLRHFDFQRGQIGSYLPRSTFPPGRRIKPDMLAYIRCSAREVVAYGSTVEEFIEMKYGSDRPQTFNAKAPAGLRLHGFALTDSGNVYGYFSLRGGVGLYYLSFDETSSTAKWSPVEGTVGTYTTPGAIVGLWDRTATNCW
jgi:hypothetical protein